MRHLLTLLTALLSFTAAQAYVPLVREGVQWIYHQFGHYLEGEFNEQHAERFYAIEFGSDTLITVVRCDGYNQNDSEHTQETFTKCYRYVLPPEPNYFPQYGTGQLRFSPIIPVAYLRDIEGVVSGFTADELIIYPNSSDSCYQLGNHISIDDCYIFYNFANPGQWVVYDDLTDFPVFSEIAPVIISGDTCKAYHVGGIPGDSDAKMVEGIGFDGLNSGDLLMPFLGRLDSYTCFESSLVCVRNKADGRIIYKGRGFEYWPFASEPADVNADAVVDVTDLGLVIDAALGLNALPDADINGDGTVDVADINAVIAAMLGQ